MTRYIRTFRKDPDEVLDYAVDWLTEGWLNADESIDTSTWTVDTGITQDSASATATVTTIWLSGGTAGESYEIANKIVTDQGRTGERTFLVIVEER